MRQFWKRPTALLLACLLSFTFVMANAEQAKTPTYQAGKYQAEARGHNGMILLETTFDEEKIVQVDILSEFETKGIGEVAFDRVINQIIEEQTLDVDVVTGATFTRRAVISIVQDCVKQAGGDVEKLLSNRVLPHVNTEVQNIEADVVVVGAGLSGISAAASAAEKGAKVIVVERLAYVGGNSSLSTGVFHFGDTDIQKAAGVEDTAEEFNDFLLDSAKKGGGERDPIQTEMIAKEGNETIKWMQSYGVAFDDKVSPAMGSPKARSHQSIPDAPSMVKSMYMGAQNAGATFMLETLATEIVVNDNGDVIGVRAESISGEKYFISGKSIVLATGGYLANQKLSEKFLGFKNLHYVGSPGALGEMLVNAMDIGAATVDLDKPFISPSYSRQGNSVITSLVLSKGAILVDNAGNRYCDETASYLQTALKTFALKQPQDMVWEIFDDQVRESVYKVKDYIMLDIVHQSDTIEDLAKEIGLDAESLKATVNDYNLACKGEKTDTFGRQILGNGIIKAPFYGIRVNPGSNIAGGGLKVDENCRVLKENGSTISGLYAVGEITGGFRAFGYAAGDSLSHCVVSGKVGGETAAEAALDTTK